MKSEFLDYIYSTNRAGSNKASSYINALEYLKFYLDGIKYFDRLKDVYLLTDVRDVIALYNFIIEQQKLGFKGIFGRDRSRKSYWHSRFYSAAVNSYKQFLIIHQYELKLNKLLEENTHSAPEELSKLFQKQKIDNIADLDLEVDDLVGRDRTQVVNARVNQYYFRKMILRNYNNQCCVNGLNIPEVLRASHIIPWSDDKNNRLNPTNGLCLSATYDAAFDRHLISFDEDYRLILGRSLREYTSNQAFKDHFKAYEGETIILPTQYLPDKHFLKKHRDRLE